LWGAVFLILPLLGTGCRCGHERTITDREQARPTMAQRGAGMEAKDEDAGVETWEPSVYLIPESSLEVVDEVEEMTSPRSSADELWVVTRRDTPTPAPPAARLGATAEGAKSLSREHGGPRPISIKVSATGFVASVDVQHTLMNSTPDTADFVYELPLPDDASVRDFTVTIGPRTIRGVIRGREEALSIYRLARERGLVTSLIDLDRASTLRNAIDNVPPGRTLQLSFSYTASLSYDHGAFELRVPLNLRATTANGIAGAGGESRAWPEASSGGAPVQMLAELDMGMTLYEVASPTHQVSVARPTPQRADVRVTGPISTNDAAFVLRCGVAGPEIALGVFSHRDPTGDYVGVCVVPPSNAAAFPRRPLELLFLLDCSESMRGMPIFTAKQLVEAGLASLDSTDTFAIATSGGRLLSRGLLPASVEHVKGAVELIRSLPPNEGEGLEAGLRTTLALPHREGQLRIVLMITDGYVNDQFGPILQLIRADSSARVFCLTTGTAAHRLLLEAIAVEGRGGIAYLRSGVDSPEVVRGLLADLSRPALTDIRVAIRGASVDGMLPRRAPDLCAGRPVTLVARCGPCADARVVVSGRGPHGPWVAERPIPPMSPANPAIAGVWARRQLSDLMREALADSATGVDDTIRAHALEHGLLSPYTSFLTIDTAG
jgi:Ca-activated chloride channel family protein